MTTFEIVCAGLLFVTLVEMTISLASIIRKERAKRTFFRCLEAARKTGIEKEFMKRFYGDPEGWNESLYERIETFGPSLIQQIYEETESLHAGSPKRTN